MKTKDKKTKDPSENKSVFWASFFWALILDFYGPKPKA